MKLLQITALASAILEQLVLTKSRSKHFELSKNSR